MTQECVVVTALARPGGGGPDWVPFPAGGRFSGQTLRPARQLHLDLHERVGAEAVTIAGLTAQGTVTANVKDDPPGLRNDGYQKLEITTGPGNEGAIYTVVLSESLPVTLPVLGEAHRRQDPDRGESPS